MINLFSIRKGKSDDNYLIEWVPVHITSSEKKQAWVIVDLGSLRKGTYMNLSKFYKMYFLQAGIRAVSRMFLLETIDSFVWC